MFPEKSADVVVDDQIVRFLDHGQVYAQRFPGELKFFVEFNIILVVLQIQPHGVDKSCVPLDAACCIVRAGSTSCGIILCCLSRITVDDIKFIVVFVVISQISTSILPHKFINNNVVNSSSGQMIVCVCSSRGRYVMFVFIKNTVKDKIFQ